MPLLPWLLGWRGLRRQPAASVLLVTLTAVIIAAPFVVGSLVGTATFTQPEVATIAMGQADVQARSTEYQEGPRSDTPQEGQAGITQVVEDRDLTLVLDGPSGSVSVTGRWLPFREPLTNGMLVREQSTPGAPELALSSEARDQLGVQLGDEVTVGDTGIELVVTDDITFAPDTSSALAIIDPAAVTESEQRALLSSSGSVRWLLATEDLQATLDHLNDLGLIATTRNAIPPADEQSLLDPIIPVTLAGVVGVTVLAASSTTLTGFHRRQNLALIRLGASRTRARSALRVESSLVTIVAALVALPVGWGATVVGRAIGEAVKHEVWGAIQLAWWHYLVTTLAVAFLGQILVLSSSSEPRQRWRPRIVTGSRKVGTHLIGSRIAWQRTRGTALGTVAIAVIVGVAAAAVLVGGLARHNYRTSYEPSVPESMVGLGFGRQLSEAEAQTLAADTDTAVTEDRRPMFQGTPIVVDSPATRCLGDPTNHPSYCMETVGVFEDTVAVVDQSAAAGFLGRELSTEERAAIEGGDGLLLAEPRDDAQLVPTGTFQTHEEYAQIINPVPVPGYADYERIPGLLISPAAMERWNLDLDTDPISYYLLNPHNERPTEQAVRAALPDDIADYADVIMDTVDTDDSAFATAQRTTTAVSSGLVFLVVVLLVLTWAAGATETLRRLSRMGAPPRTLIAVVIARGMRSIVPAAIAGVGFALALVWAFSRHVGMPVPVSGQAWLVPAIAALTALPITAATRVWFGPEARK